MQKKHKNPRPLVFMAGYVHKSRRNGAVYTLQPGSTDTQSYVPHAGFPLFKPDEFVFPFSQTDGFGMFKGMNAVAGLYPFNQVNLAGIF